MHADVVDLHALTLQKQQERFQFLNWKIIMDGNTCNVLVEMNNRVDWTELTLIPAKPSMPPPVIAITVNACVRHVCIKKISSRYARTDVREAP